MEKLYLLLILLSFILVLSDLVFNIGLEGLKSLGVVISAKSLPRWTILVFSGAGIFLGIILSDNMMETANYGIHNTVNLAFPETLFILVSIIVAEIFIVNLFRIFGIPASLTITVVFSFCGASFAAGILKAEDINEMPFYINSGKTLAIITAILFSIAVGFITGFIIQYILRVVLTFQYKKKLRYMGAFFSGISFLLLSVIVLSMAEKSANLPENYLILLKKNEIIIYGSIFLGIFILVQFVQLTYERFNVLNLLLLSGVLAITIAFAGNDISNYIGIPVALASSLATWIQTQNEFVEKIEFLNLLSDIKIPILLTSGVALFLGMMNLRKTHSYNFFKDDLSRHNTEGGERHNTYPVSRSIVRGSIIIGKKYGKYLNSGIKTWLKQRFDRTEEGLSDEKRTNDKIRIVNILLISAGLVTLGTNYQLPLSTAYITFMVTMGTSLGDRLWDKDSAIGNISGIFSMIGSWFFNSFFAFVIAAVVVSIMFIGGVLAAFILIILATISVIHNIIIHQKREVILQEVEEFPESTVRAESVLSKTNQDTSNAIIMISKAYFLGFNGFHHEDRKQLTEIDAEIEEFNQRMRKLKANIFKVIQKLQQDSIETGHYYVQIIDYLREMAHSIKFVVRPLYEHLGNSHKPFTPEQNEELIQFSSQINDFLNYSLHIIKESRFDQIEELIIKRQEINELMVELERKQIRRIKRKETNSRNSVLFFTVMSESKNLVLQTVNLLKATRDFVSYTKS